MIKVREAFTLHCNEQSLIIDESGEALDLFGFLMGSDPSMTLAEFNNQIVQSPRHLQQEFSTYAIKEQETEYTLATEDDEDFRLDNISQKNISLGLKKRTFDDSFQMPSMKNKSLSANYDISDAESIDPSTFSAKGDFIR